MNQNADDSRALFNAIVAPSGMFILNAPVVAGTQFPTEPPGTTRCTVFSLMQPTVNRHLQDEVPIQKETLFLKEFQSVQKVKLFERSQLDEYGATLFRELVPSLVQHDHDLILFPLRGCRQPGILAKVIADIPAERMVIFNYTHATRDEQQGRITSELRRQMEERIPDKAGISIGIVDTAKGGYGSEHLAKILSTLHGGRTQQWAVHFHLLHPRDSKPTLAYQIPRHGNRSLMLLWPMFYAVESLLVEDWAEGIGLSVERNGKTYELKRCAERGKILLRDETSIQLVESENLSELMTSLAVDAVNQQMQTDPQLEYVKDVLKQDAGTQEL